MSIPTRGGLLHGVIIYGESSIFCGGYIIIRTENRKLMILSPSLVLKTDILLRNLYLKSIEKEYFKRAFEEHYP